MLFSTKKDLQELEKWDDFKLSKFTDEQLFYLIDEMGTMDVRIAHRIVSECLKRLMKTHLEKK